MSRRILKWTVGPFSLMAETISTDEAVLWRAVGWQGDALVAWGEAAITGSLPQVRTRLLAVPTGAEAPEDALYVGTAMHPTLLDGAPLVMHVYAREVE